MDSVLRPRDIQARIRSGETPEAVAAAAQTTVEKIMVYAGPVLAERAWVAQQAQQASVRRRASNGPVGHLGEAVAARLAADDLDPESVEWDAWRREDGRWVLVAEYAAAAGGARRAGFVYDAAGRYVVAEDEEARRLVGERGAGAVAAVAEADGAEESSRAGRGDGADEAQTALGDDAIELVTGRRPEDAPAVAPPGPAVSDDGTADLAAEATIDLTEAARAARAARPSVPAPEEWMSTQASDRPDRPDRPQRPPLAAPPADEGLFDPADVSAEPSSPSTDEPEDTVRGASPSAEGRVAGDEQEAASEGTAAANNAADKKRKPRKAATGKGRGKGRASVPSWDEIMFGSGRGD